MKRFLYTDLIKWKNEARRKPLVLRGARQTGKSYLMTEFGRNEFPAYHIFDFEKDGGDLIPIFDSTLNPQKLIQSLGIYQDKPIENHDLIIFDEIQSCPRALTSLKYFNENLPAQAVCAAGSLLGVAVSESAYPVGKVKHLDLFPMSFEEVLLNRGQKMIIDAFYSSWDDGRVSSIVHAKLWDYLKEYYVTGGMPEAVNAFIRHGDNKAMGLASAREIQQELLYSFMRDFAKHSGSINAAHIAAVYEDIPQQLFGYVDASVKRYKFKHAVPGIKGFAQLDNPIGWLEKAGLIYKVPICKRAEVPFQAFTKPNIFKLYISDVGLLGCMLNLSPNVIINQDYGTTKGFFAENFVASEFMSAGEKRLYSWNERNSEIEFLLSADDAIIPVEVKAGTRTRAQSLRQFFIKYAPQQAIKISANPLAVTEKAVIDIPLYYAARIIGELPVHRNNSSK